MADPVLNAIQSIAPDSVSLVPAIIGVAVFIGALGVSTLVLNASDPVRRRLDSIGSDAPEQERESIGRRITRLAAPFSGHLLPTKGKEYDRIHRQLAHAGFRSATAMTIFYGIKATLAIVLALSVYVAARWLPQWSTSSIYLVAASAGFFGLIAPNYVLAHLSEKRQRLLRNAFPDALDMLVICVEAGLGLAAAIQRVGEELRFSHPELAAEFALVNSEMRAGVDRETALHNLTERTGLEDVRGLVSLLVQTMRFGTSIADTLRVYSEEFRDKRMQRAEEQAAKIGTKLIFPLVFCLFPSFFVVAIGPAVLRIISVFQFLGTRVAQ